MILHLKRKDVKTLKKTVQNEFPIEACAILLGTMNQNQAFVNKIYLASNKLKSQIRFEIEPEDFIKAINEAEKTGLELIGFFHSHQTHAKPSSLDLKNMKLWSNIIWLIFSTTNESLAAYQLINEKLIETEIKDIHR